jgi:hypothetical protein
LKIWDYIEDAIEHCCIPFFLPPLDFLLDPQVLKSYEKLLQQNKVDIQSITYIDKIRLKKFLTKEVKNVVCIQLFCPKIDKYIKIFSKRLSILRAPSNRHTFPHKVLCKNLFEEWKMFEKEFYKVFDKRSQKCILHSALLPQNR